MKHVAISIVAATAWAVTALGAERAAADKPNILFIFLDDFGMARHGLHGL